MKKLLLFALLPIMMLLGVSYGNNAYAQADTVEVGTGTSSSNILPLNMFYKNSYNQMVYYHSEIGQSGYIGAISFAKDGTTTHTIQEITIWMALTTDSALTTSSWVPQTAMKQVFHATNYVLPSFSGDMLIPLDSSFYYDGTQNLAIIVSRKDNSYSSGVKFKYTTTDASSCLYRRSDGNPSYADYPGTETGTIATTRPNVKLLINSSDDFCFPLSGVNLVSSNENSITISWPQSSGVSGYEVAITEVINGEADITMATPTSEVGNTYTFDGLNANTEYLIGVRKSCSSGSYSDWVTVMARTTAIPTLLPFTCDFETEEARAYWALDNGTVPNKWVIDTSAHYGEESLYGMYISDDTTSAKVHNYTKDDKSVVFAKCLLQFDSDGDYNVEYDWICNGERTYDYIRVALVPANLESMMEAGTELPSGVTYQNLPSGVIAADGGEKLNMVTEWQHFMGVVDIPAAGNYFLTFMWRNDPSGGANPPAAIDNISVAQSTCPRVDSVVVSNITTTSATITGYSSASDNYTLYYKVWDTDTYDTLEITSPFVLDGLTPGTYYKGMLRTNCGEDGISYVTTDFQFGTECETITLPWSFGAECTFMQHNYGDEKYPYCWEALNAGDAGYSSYQWESTSVASKVHSGDKALYFDGTSSTSKIHDDWLFTPQITFTGSEEMYFWVRSSSSSTSASYNGHFSIYASDENATSITDTANYTQLAITGANVANNMIDVVGDTWQKVTVQLPNTLVGDHHLAFVVKDINSNAFSVDDIYLYTISSCPMPDSLRIVNVSSTTASLTWSGSASSYTVSYGELGASIDEAISETTTGNTLELTNLNPNTTYEFKVMATCSDGVESAVSAPVTFTTTCAPLSSEALPFFEDFSDNTTGSNSELDECWIKGTNYTTNYPYIYESSYYEIDNCLYFYSNATSYSYAALPAFEEEVSNLMLACKVRRYTTASYNSDLSVGLMSNPYDISTFTPYDTLSPETVGEWSEFQISLANFNSESGNYIAFVLPAGQSGYSYLDNIQITARGACDSPTDVRIENVTATTATVAWTDSVATNWQVYYGTPGFNVDEATPISVSGVTSTEITDLLPQTNYEFFVTADCGDGSYSQPSLTIPFTTACAAISTLPYIEDFESYESGSSSPINPCWTKGVFGSTTQYPYPSSSAAINGNRGLYFNSYKASSSQFSCYAALPMFEEPLNNLQLRFKMENNLGTYYSTTYYSKIAMGVMSNPNDISTFDTLMIYDMSELPDGTVNNYEYAFNNYEGEGGYIAFYAMDVTSFASSSSTIDNMVYIDDVEVMMIPTCHRPDNFVATTTATTADLTWEGNAPSYEVKYSTSPDMSASTSVIVTGNTTTLNGLANYTNYYVNVRGICSATDTSEWMMENATFKTAMDCGAGYDNFVDTIGEGTSSSYTYVLNCNDFHQNTCNWTIFTVEDLASMGLVGMNNIIKSISLHVDGTGADIPFRMYMAETSVSEFTTSCADTIPLSQMTLVYDDTMTFELNSWSEIMLTTPFTYSDTANLMIAFERTDEINDDVEFFYTSLNEYRTVTVYSSTYSDSKYRQKYRGNMIFNICGDIPSCARPRNVAVTSLTSTAISLSWEATAGNYQIVYDIQDINPDEATTENTISATANNATLQGLNPNTTYYIYLRSVCGAENSSWTQPLVVTTPCDPIDLPYSENFDSYPASTSVSGGQTLDPCWSKGTNSSTTDYPYLYTTNNYSAPNSLNLYASSSVYSYVALPMFSEPINNIAMTFMLHKTSENYGTVNVGVMSDPDDINTFQTVATFQPAAEDVWEGCEVSFASYTGSGRFIAIMAPDSIISYAQVDNIEVFQIPTCQSPINITVDSITLNSAIVTWTVRGTAPANGYELEYGPQGFELGDGITMNASTNSVRLNNLSVGSTYDVYVRAKCSATDVSRWSFPATFSTDCGPIALPVFYDFEHAATGSSAVLPQCFNRYNDASTSYNQYYPYINSSNTNAYSGSNYMYWSISSYGGAQNAAMIFPEIDIVNYPMDGNQMVFKAKGGASGAQLVVGISNSHLSVVGVTVVDTLTLTSEYAEYTVQFPAYTGAHAYPIMMVHKSNSSQYVYVDDVVIEEIPACPRVYDLTVQGATATTATIAWTDTIGSTNWVVDYREAGTQSVQSIGVNTNPYTITGLTGGTQYFFNVRPICASGDTSAAVHQDASFWTTQVPATLPYSYDFEDVTEWNNWQTNSNCDINWYRGTAIAGQGTNAMYISADQGATYGSNWNRTVNAVAYRDIDFGTDTSSFTMTFKANVGGTLDHNYDGVSVCLVDPTLAVEASNSNITTPWGHVNDVSIRTVRRDTNWGVYNVHFERIAGVQRVAFYWFNQSTGDDHPYINQPGAIDSITIVEQTCLRPYDLAVTNLEANSATLNWQGTAPAYEVAYRVSGADESTDISQIVNNNSLNITNLESSTKYVFWVRAICTAGDTSYWSNGVNFKTICSRYIASDTIRENFDSVSAVAFSEDGILPDCWSAYGEGSNGRTPRVVNSGSWWYSVAGNAAVMSAGGSAYGAQSGIILPYTVEPVNSLILSYWMCTESDTKGTLEVGYLTGNNFATDFVAVKSIDASEESKHTTDNGVQPAGTGIRDTVMFDSVPQEAQVLAFRWTVAGGTFFSVSLDDVVITANITCPAPIVTTANVDASSATINWTGSAADYQLLYKEANATDWSDTIAVTANTYTLTDLMPTTNYMVKVRALCGAENGNSVWSETTFITEELPCTVPTDLATSNISFESVTLNWNASETATRWAVNLFNGVDNILDTVDAKPCTISGLSANTEYHATVKSLCSSVVSSDWSDTITFTTADCPTVTNVAVSELTTNSAVVTWNGGNAIKWELNYGLEGFGQGEGEYAETTENTYTINGLEESTTYDVYVRSYCTETIYSVWSEKVQFTTESETPEGIDGIEGNFQFVIYPNPTSASTTISLNGVEGKVTISVVDMNGRTVSTESIECGSDCEKRIDVAGLAQGTYFVRVLGDNLNSVRKLIVK